MLCLQGEVILPALVNGVSVITGLGHKMLSKYIWFTVKDFKVAVILHKVLIFLCFISLRHSKW